MPYSCRARGPRHSGGKALAGAMVACARGRLPVAPRAAPLRSCGILPIHPPGDAIARPLDASDA